MRDWHGILLLKGTGRFAIKKEQIIHPQKLIDLLRSKNNLMIIYPFEDFNDISQESYEDSISKLDIYSFTCPSCGKRHALILYGHYPRRIYSFEGELIKLNIQRVFCNSCHSSHALIPCSIVPYRRYFLAFHYAFAHNDLDAILSIFPWMDTATAARLIEDASSWLEEHSFHLSLGPSLTDISFIWKRFRSSLFTFHKIKILEILLPT